MKAVGDEPSSDDLFRKDRLSFNEHFAHTLHSFDIPAEIVHMGNLLGREQMYISDTMFRQSDPLVCNQC
ncbi:hypothetical protein B0H34DRAFT_719770 [Crassisporium funariophilum]|nr:hypothetical protein B0H34DRAFT_719770 [Crassisporium funariophilum]